MYSAENIVCKRLIKYALRNNIIVLLNSPVLVSGILTGVCVEVWLRSNMPYWTSKVSVHNATV